MQLLKADLVYPISTQGIVGGGILVHHGRIIDVGNANSLANQYQHKIKSTLHLKKQILLPCFVNAHSHLEFSTPIPYPGTFTNWIKKTFQEKEKDLLIKELEQSIQEMLKSGTGVIGEHIANLDCLKAILKSPLQGVFFWEVIGVNKERASNNFNQALKIKEKFKSKKFSFSISPHSLHAIHPIIFKKILRLDSKTPLSTHFLESKDEKDYFSGKQNALRKLIERLLINEKIAYYSNSNPTQYLKQNKFLKPKLLLVHGNYLNPEDMSLLAQQKISLIHCPSSWEYFKHKKPLLIQALSQEVNIALGTDSKASSSTLSMLDQLRILKNHFPKIKATSLLRMATLGGALALKMDKDFGTIEKGKKASFIAFKYFKNIPQNDDEILSILLDKKQRDWMMLNGKII